MKYWHGLSIGFGTILDDRDRELLKIMANAIRRILDKKTTCRLKEMVTDTTTDTKLSALVSLRFEIGDEIGKLPKENQAFFYVQVDPNFAAAFVELQKRHSRVSSFFQTYITIDDFKKLTAIEH